MKSHEITISSYIHKLAIDWGNPHKHFILEIRWLQDFAGKRWEKSAFSSKFSIIFPGYIQHPPASDPVDPRYATRYAGGSEAATDLLRRGALGRLGGRRGAIRSIVLLAGV